MRDGRGDLRYILWSRNKLQTQHADRGFTSKTLLGAAFWKWGARQLLMFPGSVVWRVRGASPVGPREFAHLLGTGLELTSLD